MVIIFITFIIIYYLIFLFIVTFIFYLFIYFFKYKTYKKKITLINIKFLLAYKAICLEINLLLFKFSLTCLTQFAFIYFYFISFILLLNYE